MYVSMYVSMYIHVYPCRYPTFDAGLLVAPVDEEVPGALGEPGQGEQLDEARNGVTCKEVVPVWFTA